MKTGVCSPKGFKAAGVRAEIKQKGLDFCVIYSENICSVAGVFTTNAFKAASVLYNIKTIKNGTAQAVVINSGNANACTGVQGDKDVLEIAEKTAKLLN